MTRTTLLAGVCAGLLAFAGAASAQSQWVEIEDAVTVSELNQTADAVEDMDVYNGAGQKVGDVEEVLGQDASTATALVVDFDDDAGYGDRDDVVVPLERFSMNGPNLVLDADVATVASYPVYND